eukprot:GILJ01029196.1.p1 GENE.GILJ01029196.1~~GILJ01029196.1.p1  ORF type:complete len:475 (-),score=83.96 GILJ01029196.1:3-1427(-)
MVSCETSETMMDSDNQYEEESLLSHYRPSYFMRKRRGNRELAMITPRKLDLKATVAFLTRALIEMPRLGPPVDLSLYKRPPDKDGNKKDSNSDDENGGDDDDDDRKKREQEKKKQEDDEEEFAQQQGKRKHKNTEEDDGKRDILRLSEGEEIDIVYTWVNGTDEKWLKSHNVFLKKMKDDIDEGTRLFSDNGELRYSLRSVDHYCKALNVRNIYIVTEEQTPSWLNRDNDRIKVITHAEMMDEEDVPSFSTFGIEINLDRIPGLREHFIYFNDDFFVGQPLTRDSFFDKKGRLKIFMSNKQVEGGECEKTHPWRCATQYVSKLFDVRYRKRRRTYAAHAPLLMSKRVMRRMRKEFAKEFKETSSHRFRGIGDNLTLYFMYAEYLRAKKYPVALSLGTDHMSYQYVDVFENASGKRWNLKSAETQNLLWKRFLETGDARFFVINKGDGKNVLIKNFLRIRFPVPSQYEDADIPNY